MPEPTPVRAPGPASEDRTQDDTQDGTQDGTHDSQPAGRDRLLSALRSRGSRGQAVVGLLLAALGFAAAVQLRANDQSDSFTGARQADLIALISTLSLATDRAEAEIRDLQLTRDALRSDTEARQTALDLARTQVETLGILAGSISATGPGVRITVESRSGEVGTDQLLNGIQALRDAGAEAVEINDTVRVVAQTGITDSARSGLVVDGVALRPPLVIEAIGDPHTLATSVDFDGSFIDEVEQVGGTVDVQELDDVEIASTVSVPAPAFAQPAEQE